MKSTLSAETVRMDEMRRLLAERAAKKRELDNIDKAIEACAGMDTKEDRPKTPRLSPKSFRAACGMF